MQLSIKLLKGGRKIVNLSERVRVGQRGHILNKEQLDKKLNITARAIAGDQYKKHRVIWDL